MRITLFPVTITPLSFHLGSRRFLPHFPGESLSWPKLIFCTVEALVSGHPRNAKKVSVTGAGRLREWFLCLVARRRANKALCYHARTHACVCVRNSAFSRILSPTTRVEREIIRPMFVCFSHLEE